MSKNVKHMYEVIEDTTSAKLEAGTFLVQDKHIRKEHEPERVWHAVNIETGKSSHIVGKHIGEYEKVKDYVQGYRDAEHLPELVEAATEVLAVTPSGRGSRARQKLGAAIAKATGEEQA